MMKTEATFSGGTLTVTRLYKAPREAVFEAWVETSKVEKWWGCAQTTAVRSEIEPRVGGVYNHYMTLENAGEFPGLSRFVEYDPPNRLSYTSDPPEGEGQMTVTVDFIEEDGGTRVRLTHNNIPTEVGPPHLPTIIQAGWTAALGKLDSFLMAAAA